MKDRIKKIRKENGLSQVELARRLDVSQSVISLIESGQASVSLEILKKFTREFDLSSDWLIYGKSRFVKLSPENSFMPLVGLKAQAGYLTDSKSPEFKENLQLYRLPGYEGDDFQILEVDGDNMIPTIYPKDLLVCKKHQVSNHHISDGDLYVLVTPKGFMQKRVYRDSTNRDILILKSDNENYNEEELPLEEVAEMWRVRGKLTSRFADEIDGNAARVDRLESEISWMKKEIESLLVLSPRHGGNGDNGNKTALNGPSPIVDPHLTNGGSSDNF